VQGEAVLIRREGAADIAAVRAVTGAAFARPEAGGPELAEVRLLDELRGSVAWRPELSLVAVSVRPGRQRAGVGSALMHTVLGAGDALGEPMAVLLGDPGYYRRFGFRLSSAYQITPPRAGWEPYLQVRELSGYRAGMTGTFRYAEPFDRT
jgi:putative acetyltransferase